MPYIVNKCKSCGKSAVSEAEFSISGKTMLRLKCGHITSKEQLSSHRVSENLLSLDNKKLMPFQCEGDRFIDFSGGRCLLADDMGLGKTVQALSFCIRHDDKRFLAVVKSSLKVQWQYESMRWGGEDFHVQIINRTSDTWLKGMRGYIISYDLLPRFNEDKLEEALTRVGIDIVILDECQQIKNPTAARTRAVRRVADPSKRPYCIAMSGTPIMNHAGEFFPVLNILKPEIFPEYARFLREDCVSDYNGYGYKVGGLRRPAQFKEKTKSFIIRRTREEVLPDLPLIQRGFSYSELGPAVEKAYTETLRSFQEEYDSSSAEMIDGTLAYLSKMRHLTGLAKVDPTIDFTMEFLGSNERKLAIFYHHQDVGALLSTKLTHTLKELELNPPLRIIAEMSPEERFDEVQKFDDPKNRIILLSTGASAEGLNLQVCADFIMMERQWNPAREEQAEGRFPRPGQQAQSIQGTYMVAVGTIDEFFAEIVERKRAIVSSTMRGEIAEDWNQASIMKELAEQLALNGGRRWSF